MSSWEDLKEFTKSLALSKPLRWLMSGVAGLTFGGTVLNWMLDLLPTTAGFIAFDILFVLTTSLLVARATSRGYTAVEEALKKIEEQQILLSATKKDLRTCVNIVEAQQKMITGLVADMKYQNENNISSYLQQTALLRFCEAIAHNQPDEEKDFYLTLLLPPTLDQVQGKKRQPNMLASTLIYPDSDTDSDTGVAEDKINSLPEYKPSSTAHAQSLMDSIYRSAESVYGTFWKPSSEVQLTNRNDESLLASIPQDSNTP